MVSQKNTYIHRWIAVVSSILLSTILLVGCTNTINQEGDQVKPTEETNLNEETTRVGGKEVASLIMADEYERLYAQFSPPLKADVSLQEFRALGKDFVKEIESFQQQSHLLLNGNETFVWTDETTEKGLMVVMDTKGTIQGIRILDFIQYPETDETLSKTVFDMPFHGEWLVVWGGKNVFVNYHYEFEFVRYALDFVKEKNGYSYEGDPTLNESYYAFNEDILTPAAGKVVAAVDGIADNKPGSPTGMVSTPLGNHVTIQHDNGEFSTLGHFKNGSVIVKPGDIVTVGQRIAKVGNSGESTEPHLHIQVQTKIDEETILNIPMAWKDGLQPIQGDIVTGVSK